MTLSQKVAKKISKLPPKEQRKVLQFAESLERKKDPKRLRDPEGLLADQPSNLTLEDFKAARREMWQNFPREFPR